MTVKLKLDLNPTFGTKEMEKDGTSMVKTRQHLRRVPKILIHKIHKFKATILIIFLSQDKPLFLFYFNCDLLEINSPFSLLILIF